MATTITKDLFSSLISDIKAYTGKDPLLPWLRGIRKMRDSLPPELLKEKLPRFLQKCAQAFESDRLYRNDLRYLRVWLQLMDFVDDPKPLLRTMEIARIGMKRSLFYLAYALYYEKNKKFEEAEKVYRLGIQNLAEPVGDLHKSFEQFLHRMERHKNKRIQRKEGEVGKRHLAKNASILCGANKENNDNLRATACRSKANQENTGTKSLWDNSNNLVPLKESNHLGISGNSVGLKAASKSCKKKEVLGNQPKSNFKVRDDTGTTLDEPRSFCSDDTVVVKFVDTAIVGKSEAEGACHHGLVDPTINMMEAMNAINSMFQEPLEPALVDRKSRRSQPTASRRSKGDFVVFMDENSNNKIEASNQKEEEPHNEPFEIFVDNEENESADRSGLKDDLDRSEDQSLREGSVFPVSHSNFFVFPTYRDNSSQCEDDTDVDRSPVVQLGEDTVVCRFVGSTILDEPKVENACHHGLVEPTINLKEAMDDINGMFGKPIEFVRASRPRKKAITQESKASSCGGFSILPDDDLEEFVAPDRSKDCGGFSILPDDDLQCQRVQAPPPSSFLNSKDCDLFEPTHFTKEAMDDINKLFGMPLDF